MRSLLENDIKMKRQPNRKNTIRLCIRLVFTIIFLLCVCVFFTTFFLFEVSFFDLNHLKKRMF